MTIGTAGHIDHGKSALVEALTGAHPDRLAAERRRGITLDLGFGHLALHGPGGEIAAGVVDVPGHERFVRTMLAGAGGVDVLLLVVAADAGVQPQTREHFEICRLLGIERAVIALTKCDLATAERRQAVRQQVAEMVARSPLRAAPLVEVSVRTREGLDALRHALWEAGQSLAGRDARAPFRLPVDRAFSMKGFGTVATGTLTQGTIAADSEIALLGSPRRVRVRGIQVHGQTVAAASAGQRTALNLAGVEPRELERGAWLAEPGVFGLSDRLDVELAWLPAAPKLPHRTRVHFYLHTAERIATLLWLSPPGEGAALAQLRLDAPVTAVPGDRFILRRLSPVETVGGGRILDVQPPRHRPADYAAAAAFLRQLDAAGGCHQQSGHPLPAIEARPQATNGSDPAKSGVPLAAAPERDAVLLRLRRAGGTGMSLEALGAALGWRIAALGERLGAWAEQGWVVLGQHPEAVVLAEEVYAIEAEILQQLAAFHAREPLAPGAPLERLAAKRALPWVEVAAERLRASGKMESVPGSSWFRLPGRGASLSVEHRGLRDRIEAHFRQAGLGVPPLPEVLAAFPELDARQLVQTLVREGLLVACQPAILVHAEALAGLRQWLRARQATQPRFSVAEFKQWSGLSRKFAIPLLEYLDQQRLTRRVGELREIL